MTLPRFLNGCFDWRENGYHWPQLPNIDLRTDAALKSDDPWVAIAAVVERAKAGDHAHSASLVRFFYQHEPFALSRIALLAYADVAPKGELMRLEQVLLSDDEDSRLYAAEAAALCGHLALVPAMLDAWKNAQTLGEHESIGFKLSDVLEEQPGPIAENAGIYIRSNPAGPAPTPALERLRAMKAAREADAEPPPLLDLVPASHDRLATELSEDAIVWAGGLSDVNRLIDVFQARLQDPESKGFVNFRHRFEAWTGEPCQDFFWAQKPQRLNMAATLEDFVRAGKGAHYKPGLRYFFGHPVPE